MGGEFRLTAEEFEELKKLSKLSKLKEVLLIGNNFQFSHSEEEFSAKVRALLPQVESVDGVGASGKQPESAPDRCPLKENYFKFESNAFLDLIINLKSAKGAKLSEDITIHTCYNLLNEHINRGKGFEMNDVINGPNHWNIFVGEIFRSRESESSGPRSSEAPSRHSIVNSHVFLKFRMWNLASLDLSRFQREKIKEINLDYNRFKEIPPEVLSLPFLEKLSMIKNKISRLTFASPNDSLVTLLLGNNKIHKSSDLKVGFANGRPCRFWANCCSWTCRITRCRPPRTTGCS